MTSSRTSAGPAGVLGPDELAELEEERDHLLASLEDLEREHDAGDLDDVDYEALKDDYTARAAEVLRALEEHRRVIREAGPRRSPGRTAAVVVGVLAFAVVAGVLVARGAGQRGGGTLTGNDNGLREQLANCQPLAFQDPAEGVDCYQEILDASPDNVEALTYQGWALIRDDRVSEGAERLDRVVELDPDYPDARVFRAVVASRAASAAGAAGDREAARAAYLEAAEEIDRFYRNDPPEVAVQVLQQELLEFKIFLGLLEEATAACWAEALGSRGDGVALDQQLYDDLGACAEGVLATRPEDTDALFTRALAEIGPERQDLPEASATADRLLAVAPEDPNGLLLRASIALAEGRPDAARADLDALDALSRPTAAFLVGTPEQLRDVLDRAEGAASTTTTSSPSPSGASVSTVPGAPVIPNASGG